MDENFESELYEQDDLEAYNDNEADDYRREFDDEEEEDE